MNIALGPAAPTAVGGPRTFHDNLRDHIVRRGHDVVPLGDGRGVDAVLLINASRQWRGILRARRSGARIVQRLGSPGYALARRDAWGPARLRALRDHAHIRLARRVLPHHVIYQSTHSRGAWEARHGQTRVPASIVPNGVDTDAFLPGRARRRQGPLRVLSVEGSQDNDPFRIAGRVSLALDDRGVDHEMILVGHHDAWAPPPAAPHVRHTGPLPRQQIAAVYRSADVFLSTDILEAGCPNSVLEAMASGLPVVGYNAGPLPELAADPALLTDPEENPWRGRDVGGIDAVAEAVERAGQDPGAGRRARDHAVAHFGLAAMGDAYERILTGAGDP